MPARVLIDSERTWRWVPYLSEEVATGGRSRWRVGLQKDVPEHATGWLQVGDDAPSFIVFGQLVGRYPNNPAAVLYSLKLVDPHGRRAPAIDPASRLMEAAPIT